MQRGRCDKRAIDGMKGNTLFERVRDRFSLVRLRQLILCVRQRVQLRRLLRKQNDNGEKQALQRARSRIEDRRHTAIVVHPGAMRYWTRHCFSPSTNSSSGSVLPMNTITLPRLSSGPQGLPISPPMSMCTPWNTTRLSFPASHSTPL